MGDEDQSLSERYQEYTEDFGEPSLQEVGESEATADTPDESDAETVSVEIHVSGRATTETEVLVIEEYEDAIETFLRKNKDYGNSFERSAKLQSVLTSGEINEDKIRDVMAEQIFVRGFLDKLSRFHQLELQDTDAAVDDETVHDTLQDLGNYALMLASKYE